MMKRLLVLAMTVICSLSLVGCDNITNESGSKINQAKIGVTIVKHPLEAKADGKVYATGCYPEIILSEDYADSFPNLASSIDSYNSDWENNAKNSVKDYGYMNQQYGEGDATGYIAENTVDVVRADDRLLSALAYSYTDADGAHPSHYTYSINLDTNTGHVLGLSEVITDKEALWKKIREKIFEKYPDNKEDIENYLLCECAIDGDPFEVKMNEDTYTWTLSDEGVHIYFSPYEIASYATGDMDVVITEDDIPGLIQENYKASGKQDIDSIVTKQTAETEELEPESMGDGEEYEYTGESQGVIISNPTWHKYTSDSVKPAAEKHITLTETSKDKTDWLDTSVWAEKNGFEEAFLSYGDGNYYYAPGDGGDFGYEFTTLFLYDYQTNELLHTYDLAELCNGPDAEEGKESMARQYIRWAKAMDGILYVSLSHNGYTSEESRSGYMVAIDMKTDTVLWRSEPQVSNACNFQIVDDTIICGYGFTAEPDYMYLLDKNTGEKVEQIKIESAASQFEIKDDTLYVATYNTAYTYKINR
ncbi:Protein of unknown function (DUF3298) [Butyrivibrio fibrisolvens 16/4]|nr:Protein of unknown function (DUF3298) [Butyrivibrio fibrisolvens 16/4]